jgi:hypothetical protein
MTMIIQILLLLEIATLIIYDNPSVCDMLFPLVAKTTSQPTFIFQFDLKNKLKWNMITILLYNKTIWGKL